MLYWAPRGRSVALQTCSVIGERTRDRLSELLAGNAFQISLQPNWQIDNGFFNRQILALGGTQLRAQNNNYSAVSQTDLEVNFHLRCRLPIQSIDSWRFEHIVRACLHHFRPNIMPKKISIVILPESAGHISLPVHAFPSPVNPGLHSHWNDPSILVHSPFGEQSLVSVVHSSISIELI